LSASPVCLLIKCISRFSLPLNHAQRSQTGLRGVGDKFLAASLCLRRACARKSCRSANRQQTRITARSKIKTAVKAGNNAGVSIPAAKSSTAAHASGIKAIRRVFAKFSLFSIYIAVTAIITTLNTLINISFSPLCLEQTFRTTVLLSFIIHTIEIIARAFSEKIEQMFFNKAKNPLLPGGFGCDILKTGIFAVEGSRKDEYTLGFSAGIKP
jgi:hypothetical protein